MDKEEKINTLKAYQKIPTLFGLKTAFCLSILAFKHESKNENVDPQGSKTEQRFTNLKIV
jgi:hypothetical protein